MMEKLEALTKQDADKLMAHIESQLTLTRRFALDAVVKHQESKVSIYVQTQDITRANPFSYEFVKAKAVLINEKYDWNNKIEVDCLVASNKLYQLKDSKNNKINLLDHLNLLLPSPNFSKIGLFTFQNGIQNAFSDFEKMGNEILSHLRKQGHPLCMGFYNATNGVFYGSYYDLLRLNDQWSLNPHSVVLLRQLIFTLAGILPRNILWAHIAHSEGGLIANQVLTTEEYKLGREQFDFIKRRLITLTYGAVAPVPNIVLEAINTYSYDDIAMNFARKYLDKDPTSALFDKELKKLAQGGYHEHLKGLKGKSAEQIDIELKQDEDKNYESTKNGCTVRIVKSKVPRIRQPLIEGDHGFLKDTYKSALENNIKYVIGTYKVL